MGNSGSAGAGLDVAEVFSTFLYTGNGGAQTITNNIDLSGEGGLVWIKDRTYGNNHFLWDTTRGVGKGMITSFHLGEQSESTGLTAFNSNGFALGGFNGTNPNTYKMCSWTFRKAPKFFDIVTYTGNGASGRLIDHNLGSAPGMVTIKCTSTNSTNWSTYHRGLTANNYILLNTTAAQAANSFDRTVSSTQYELGPNWADENQNGRTYVAYFFAHNDDDGEFGPGADQDIIKCGSISGFNGRADLGFEPQWVLLKQSNSTSNWILLDVMREWTQGNENDDAHLFPNLSSTEADYNGPSFDATGFNYGQSGENWIYMAIRSPMITKPKAATDVFAMDTSASSAAQAAVPPVQYYAGFPVDMMLKGSAFNGSGANYSHARLTNGRLRTDSTAVETVVANHFDSSQGYRPISLSANTNYIAYLFKRAIGYFDVVAYTGNASNPQDVKHSLGVVPEMVWHKKRSADSVWKIWHKDAQAGGDEEDGLQFDNSDIFADAFYTVDITGNSGYIRMGNTGSNFNGNGITYVMYLFSTLAGVSKVGSVTHSGSSTDVDCGFSNGARFVLLKRDDANGDWYYWDSVRGIIAGNDPYLLLNTNAAHVTNTDFIDPLSSGFQISGDFTDGDYIFYAIA